MGNPEPRGLQDLQHEHPLWTITAHGDHYTAHRLIHPALRHLAPWNNVRSPTLDTLTHRLAHLDTLADAGVALLMATQPPTPTQLAQIHQALARL